MKEIIEAKENMNETIEIEARETVKRAEGSKSNGVTYVVGIESRLYVYRTNLKTAYSVL